jgi:RNA polymerase sigma-70 factor (ECF subfamily)
MRDSNKDTALFSEIASGGEAAFAELYRRLGDDVYRFAYALTRSASAAQDVTQDVFLSVLEHAERYDARRGSARTWLLGCARNIAVDRLRRDARWCADPPEARTGCDGEDSVFRQQRETALLDAIERLPGEFKETLVLCELTELSYAEAAAVMRCPVGTVRSRLHRARAMLCADLGGRAHTHRAAETCDTPASATAVPALTSPGR